MSAVRFLKKSFCTGTPPGYRSLIPPRDPEQIAKAILDGLLCEPAGPLREHFLSRFTLECHLTNLAEAIRSVETAEPTPALQPAAQNP